MVGENTPIIIQLCSKCKQSDSTIVVGSRFVPTPKIKNGALIWMRRLDIFTRWAYSYRSIEVGLEYAQVSLKLISTVALPLISTFQPMICVLKVGYVPLEPVRDTSALGA